MDSLTASLLEQGVPLVGLNVFLQQLGLPIPAVPTMIVAGAMAAAGRLSGLGVFAISVAASVIADLLWFWAGRRYGYKVLKLLCRVSLSPDTCVRQTEGIFERYGFFSVVVSKFVPGFSTVAPPIAGALDMSFGAFVVAAFASAALWVGAAMTAGFVFSAQVDFVLAWMSENAVLAAGLVGGLLAAYVLYKAWQRWRLARFVAASRITVDELASMIDQSTPFHLVDVGSKLAHGHRPHIPGAVLLDLDEIDKRASDFPDDRDIVLYCACPNEESARRAAQLLTSRGFKRARPLKGGLDAWIASGRKVAHASAPIVVIERPKRAA
ncbi:MAG TPA: VTT domain-containing protein [Casimicrobiaceae bacterium]|jgi:membrane protein DedA with SNARE-associated domain/rhodanese-related sulfurtransferase|nr:VTT domain-containing protein [Casimicrobiaceae bacterium]